MLLGKNIHLLFQAVLQVYSTYLLTSLQQIKLKTMSEQNVSLETEFELEQLNRFLIQNPDKAHELAMNYYEDCLIL